MNVALEAFHFLRPLWLLALLPLAVLWWRAGRAGRAGSPRPQASPRIWPPR